MRFPRAVLSMPVLILAAACGDERPHSDDDAAAAAVPAALPEQPVPQGANVVEVTAVGLHEFRLSTSEVPSGWTTFRLQNASPAIHFAVVEKLPDGITIEDYKREVAPSFQEGMDRLDAGDPDAAMAAFGRLPEWFGQVVFMGGPGLVSTGGTAVATVDLDPGTYLIECYVKTPEGQFHSYLGMVEQFTVTEVASGASEPEATLRMTISREGGIDVDTDVPAGLHTIAVHFEDQSAHENFVGHDVHLVRLDADVSLDALASWMDWTRKGGLQEPAPVEFVGGLNEMPAGTTGYFTAQLEPGEYAWISEVPDPAGKGMLRTFTVAAGADSGS